MNIGCDTNSWNRYKAFESGNICGRHVFSRALKKLGVFLGYPIK